MPAPPTAGRPSPGRTVVEPAEPPDDLAGAFADLVAYCVPTVCDQCYVELAVAGEPVHRVDTRPADADTGPAGDLSGGQLRVAFAGHADGSAPAYSGTAAFAWHSREPGSADDAIAELLVERAVRTIAWKRSAQAALAATSQIGNLKLALETNRGIAVAIGIVMSTRKINQDQAFELLAKVSQHTHRKLRAIADEVVETGWLDPTLAPAH